MFQILLVLRKTTDGGANWSATATTSISTSGGIACSSLNNCYFASDSSGSFGAITSNGGTSYNNLRFGETLAKKNGNCISGTTTCIFAGSTGSIVYSTLGTVWAPHFTNITSQLNNAVCTSATQCFAVGNGGVIVRGN